MQDVTVQKRTNGAGRHRAARVARPAAVRPVRRVSPVLLALCLAGTGAVVAGCGGSAPGDTVLRGAAGVTVVAADGAGHPGVDGEKITAGEVVRTSTSRAELVTGGRVVTLAPASAVGLVSATGLRLDQGTLVVDRRHGSAASVAAGPVTVADLGRTAVRVERGFAVRVAVYDGGGATVTAGGRDLGVDALHEVDVPGTSLPTDTAPLALRDDALDAVGSPDLVAADVALVQRAAGLDAPSGAAGIAAVRSAVPRVLPAATTSVGTAGSAPSERVLPVAIALAGSDHDTTTAYAQATALRSGGGSWGVVATLLGARLAGVQDRITDLLDTPVDAGALTPVAAAPPQSSGIQALLAAAVPTAAATAPATAPTARPTTPAASATPTPSPTPTTLVGGLVGTIVGLLPGGGSNGSTATGPSRAAASPAATPTASTSATGLLGGLLGK